MFFDLNKLNKKLETKDILIFNKQFFNLNLFVDNLLIGIEAHINNEFTVMQDKYDFGVNEILLLENKIIELRKCMIDNSELLLNNYGVYLGVDNAYYDSNKNCNEYTLFQLSWLLICKFKFVIYYKIVVINDIIDEELTNKLCSNDSHFSYLLLNDFYGAGGYLYNFNLSQLAMDLHIMQEDFVSVINTVFEFSINYHNFVRKDPSHTKSFLEVLELKIATYILVPHNIDELNCEVPNLIKKMVKFINGGEFFSINNKSITLFCYYFHNFQKEVINVINNNNNVALQFNDTVANIAHSLCDKRDKNDNNSGDIDGYVMLINNYNVLRANLMFEIGKLIMFNVVSHTKIFENYIAKCYIDNNEYCLYDYYNNNINEHSIPNTSKKIQDVLQVVVSQKELFYYRRIVNNVYTAHDIIVDNSALLLDVSFCNVSRNLVFASYISILINSHKGVTNYKMSNIFKNSVVNKFSHHSNYIIPCNSFYILVIGKRSTQYYFNNVIDAFCIWLIVEYANNKSDILIKKYLLQVCEKYIDNKKK